jgi:rubrerythrin
MVLKLTIQCQVCGLKLKDYPVRGPTLPKRCPRCGAPEPFKEYRDKVFFIPSIVRR